MPPASSPSAQAAQARLLSLFDELLGHDGFGSLTVEMRLLKRGQKEVILDCGKQYRYVIDFEPRPGGAASATGSAAAASG